ncbi:MAG: hypothetical protein ACRD2S_10895, partial [Terriglobales bacterium]
MNDELKLLVEWSSPWEEFVTSIRPALSRSAEPLAAETYSGLFPGRDMLVVLVVEAVLVTALILLPPKLRSMQAFQPAPPPKYDVIYFSGDELPRTEDSGGARAGNSGRPGGREGHHATQVIRVARGPSLKEQVVDAPKLNLPSSNSAVANLLAYKSLPGPPPDKGLESSLRHAEMPVTAIPPPATIQDQGPRSAPDMDARVVAPTPNSLRHELNSRRAYESHESVVPPPVSAPQEVTILHPQLTLPQSLVVPPAPSERQIRTDARSGAGDLRSQTAVPPAPQVANDLTGRQPSRAYDSRENVVPPPASAPNEIASLHSQPSLPQSSVVPPAPSAREIRTDSGFPAGDLRKQTVVPPAPQAADVLPDRRAVGVGNVAAVAPASQVNNVLSARRHGVTVNNAVVGPPSQISNASFARGPAKSLGQDGVVPPPAQLNGSLMDRRANRLSGKISVVQPSPSAGTGLGTNGQEKRGPQTMAESVVPPSPALASGIVLSARPGPKVGSPSNGSAGSLAMSPSGGPRAGLGGAGGGEGIGNGSGPGSSTSGQAPGAKTNASGQGSNETAHNGISPFPGPGGAGR